MKICSKCKKSKPYTEFSKDASRADGHAYRCKVCQTATQRSGYTERYGDKSRLRNRETAAKNRKILNEHKAALGCKVCGEREPVCLEFHHLDPTKKEIGIAGNMGSSIDRLFKEIEKCVCVCGNCHRKIHAGIISIT
jgi:hypothetical protein